METASLITLSLRVALGLLVVWSLWFLVLRNVNRFGAVRVFLLSGVLLSVIVPVMLPYIQGVWQVSLPTPNIAVTIALPEVTVGTTPNAGSLNWINMLAIAYLATCGFFMLKLSIQIIRIIRLVASGRVSKENGLYIVEHTKPVPPFSFLNLCFINTEKIPEDKQNEVIRHERAHWLHHHSADILLLELIGIFQWFNPFYWLLRRELVRVHEYQADAHAVQSESDTNSYLNTIVSLAFSGVAVGIGNNLNRSLTLKRLAMLTTEKKQSRRVAAFRLALTVSIACALLLVISCEKSEEPTEINNKGAVDESITEKTTDSNHDDVFVVVEEMPMFEGGSPDKFREYISNNLKYPESAKENGIQGRVFISFIIEADGMISNIKVERGVDPILDNEAIRVVASSPNWTPGKQRGQAVRTSFTFPIHFALE